MRNIKINTKANTTKAASKAAKPADATPVAPATEAKAKPALAKHDLTHTYAGASAPFTSRKSRTPINAEFNRLAGEPITSRDAAFLNALKTTYGKAEFPRLNADAGNLRRAIERGYLNYGKAPNSFMLTERALTERLA